MSELGEFIREKREEKGMTQAELHNEIIDVAEEYEFPIDLTPVEGTGSTTISLIENGQREPDALKRKFISRALDFPYTELEELV